VPVPRTAPGLLGLWCITCSGVIAYGGSQSGGGETPMSVEIVIEHFFRAENTKCNVKWGISQRLLSTKCDYTGYLFRKSGMSGIVRFSFDYFFSFLFRNRYEMTLEPMLPEEGCTKNPAFFLSLPVPIVLVTGTFYQ
jgi:hypothetical protein